MFDDDFFNIDPNEPQDGFAEGFFDIPAPEEYEYTGEGFLGAMGDIGRGLWEGTLDDLVGGAFQAGEWIAPSGSPLEDAFAAGDDYITRLLDTNPELFKESEIGEKARAENWLNPRGWLHPGMKSVGPMVGAALTGPAAPATIGLLYYGRTSQEAYDDSLERFPEWDEAKRLTYANTKGIIEGGGEAIQMALFRGLWKAMPSAAKGSLLKGAAGAVKPGIGFLKRFAGMIAGEEITETGQEYTGRLTDYWYGLEKEMPTVTQAFKDVFGPTLIASAVMGSGGSLAQMQADKTLNQNLSHIDTPRDIRTQAAATVYQRLKGKDRELADQWWNSIKENLLLNDPIIIGNDVNYKEQLDPEETALQDIGEEAAPPAEEGAPTTEEPFDDTGVPFEQVAAEEEVAFEAEQPVDVTDMLDGESPEADSPFVDITPEDLDEAVAIAEADLGLEPEAEVFPEKEAPTDVFGPEWEAEQGKVKTEASELEMAELEEQVTGRPVKFALKRKIEPLAEPAIAGEGEGLKTLTQEPGEAGIKALAGDEKVVEKDHYEGAFGNHRFVKRDESGKIIGAVQVLSKGAKNVVTGIYVTPEARRQKVGSDLIDTARSAFPGLQVSQFMTEPGAEFFGVAPKAGDRATEWYGKLTPRRKRLIKESYDNYLENQDLISEDQAIADFETVIEISKNLQKEASKAQDRPEAEAITKEFDPENEFNIEYDYYDNIGKTWNFTAKGAGPNNEFATSGENDGVSFGIKDLSAESFSNRFDEKAEEYSKKVDIKFALRDTEVKGEQDEEKRPSRDRRTPEDRGIDGEPRVEAAPSEKRLDVTEEIRIDDIRKAFPTASVQTVEGGFVVDLPNDAQIFVNLVGEIAIDREAALRAGYTEQQIAELSPAGTWVTFADEAGTITLSKIAKVSDLNHETFHAAMELVLTPEEVADVLSKFEREEDAAAAYGDWAADQDAPHTAFQKIAKFFKNIVNNLMGGEKAVFARIKSGKPFERAVRASMKQRVPVSQWTPEMVMDEIENNKVVAEDPEIKYSLNHTNHQANIATKSQQQLWYSDMVRAIGDISDKARPQAQWQKEISQLADRTKAKRVAIRDENNRPTGEVEIKETHIPGQFRRSELEWSGVLPWLSTQSGKISKERVMNYLDANLPKLGEVVLSEYADRPENEVRQYFDDILDDLIANDGQTTITDDMGNALRIEMEFYDPKEDTATVTVYKGDELKGESYFGFEEFVSDVTESAAFDHFVWPTPRHEDYQMFGPKTGYRELVITLDGEDLGFRRPEHYPIKNVVVHARFNTRVDAAGRRTLHIEELQSDHLQALRAGKDVKPAPFLKEWPALGIKRLLRWATDNGYDQMTWTTGAQQADRFSAAFRYSVDKINWKLAGGVYEIDAVKEGKESFYADFDLEGNAVSDVPGFTGRPHMSEIIGKNLSGQILGSEKSKGSFEGDSLTVGAEGFKAFYDSEFVNTVKKIVRPFGSTVETAEINVAEAEDLPDVTVPVHSVEITPKMKETVPGGASMWSRAKYSLGTSEPWYSTLGRAAGELKQQKGSPDQMLAMLKKSPGVKQEEIDWVGLEEWMLGKKSVTKDEIVAYLGENDVGLEEVALRSRETRISDMTIEERADILGYTIVPNNEGGVDLVSDVNGDIAVSGDMDRVTGWVEAQEEYSTPKDQAKFEAHQLPGGAIYRELLITLPEKDTGEDAFRSFKREMKAKYGLTTADISGAEWVKALNNSELKKIYDLRDKYKELGGIEPYISGHFGEPNILVHARFNERVDAGGQRVLFIEELQSDWAQKGRKKGFTPTSATLKKLDEHRFEVIDSSGRVIDEINDKNYSGPWDADSLDKVKDNILKTATGYSDTAPDMPYKKTQQWTTLALRRMITWSAQNGFDRIAWTTGTQQAARYDLSKQISAIDYDTSDNMLTAKDVAGDKTVIQETVAPDKLDDFIGKEVADRIRKKIETQNLEEDDVVSMSGLDLQVGGEGMIGFYDRILPSAANKIIKKYGGRVGETNILTTDIYSQADFEAAAISGTLETAKEVMAEHGQMATVHSFDITSPLKAKALGGMPKFSLVPGKTKPIQHADKLTGLIQRLQDNQTDILTKQRELARYIQRSLPIPERGRRELVSAITKLAVPKTKATRTKYFQQALELIDKRVETVEHKEAVGKIVEKLKRLEPRKVSGKQVGKLPADVHNILSKIQDVMAMSPDEASVEMFGDGKKKKGIMHDIGETMESISPEQRERIFLLSTFSDLGNRNSVDVWKALEHIVTIEETGRYLFNIVEDRRKAKNEALSETALKEFTGQDDITMDEIIEKNRKRQREEKTVLGKMLERLGTFDTMHQSWEWKLDALSKYSKETDVLKGLTTDHFRRTAHIATTDSDYGSWEQMQKLRDKAEEIYGVKGRKLEKKLLANTVYVEDSGVFNYKDGQKREITITQNEAYKIWQWMKDDTLKANMAEHGYTADTMAELEKFMSPEVKAWAEWQIYEFYPKYYESINKVYRAMYHVDLPYNPMYTPMVRERGADLTDDMLLMTETPYASTMNGSLKLRIDNKLPPRLSDGDAILSQHITQMEHFKAWAEPVREMRGVLGSPKVQGAIQAFHGTASKTVIQKFLNDFARGGADRAMVMRGIDSMRSAFVKAVIGANPVVFAKQLTSFPAFATDMPIHLFLAGMVDFASNPIAKGTVLMTSKKMMMRGVKGWERDIADAMKRAAPAGISEMNTLTDKLMFPTKIGDKAAIMAGGWSVYKWKYDGYRKMGIPKEKAHAKAIVDFEMAYERGQQASGTKDQSHFQRMGSLYKAFTMFMTSPQQYYNHLSAGYRNLYYGRGSKAENVKRIAIAQFVLPMIFQFMASGFEWEDEDQLRAVLMGPFNGLFIAKDFAEPMIRAAATGRLPRFGNEIPIVSTATGLATVLAEAHRIITGEGGDVGKAIDKTLSTISKLPVPFIGGVPYDPLKRIGTGAWAAVTGETEHPIRRSLGWSKYALERDEEPTGRRKVRQIKKIRRRPERRQ